MRAPNWLGDAVMSLPAVRALRAALPSAHVALVARPSLAELYRREGSIDQVIAYPAPQRWRDRTAFARRLRAQRFDAAILLQNAFDAALIARLARIPQRIGYRRDGRGWLLTQAIPVPEPGEIPRHERFYYLELLRRAGMLERFPACDSILLDRLDQARSDGRAHLRAIAAASGAIGISPGAAYGNAKRWLPERFAETARLLARETDAAVLVFGSAGERALCEQVATEVRKGGVECVNLAGETTLREFIDLAAACRLLLVNDSGAMHIAAAVGVPCIAVFGATDDTATGPASPLARVIREPAECSPCLLRECPIDHRCMTRVAVERVAGAAREALGQSTLWTHGERS